MNIKKLLPYITFIASACIIFTYFGWTADKLMSCVWIKDALIWSLLFGLFYFSIYKFYLTQTQIETEKKQKKLEKEKKEKRLHTLTSNEKALLSQFYHFNIKRRSIDMPQRSIVNPNPDLLNPNFANQPKSQD